MKTKILILILLSSLILGCRTRTKKTFYKTEGKTEIERIKFDSIKSVDKKESTKKVYDHTVKKQKEDFSGDIIIKGKSDSLNPLIFHNVVSGDTLQSILIKGNADYLINNRYKKAAENTEDKKNEQSSNIIKDIAQTAVSKKTIKEVANTVKEKTNDIKYKGFQFGAWFTIVLFGIIIICLVFLWVWFRKTTFFKNIVERLNNKK